MYGGNRWKEECCYKQKDSNRCKDVGQYNLPIFCITFSVVIEVKEVHVRYIVMVLYSEFLFNLGQSSSKLIELGSNKRGCVD